MILGKYNFAFSVAMQCAVERFIYRLIDTVEAVEPYFKAKPSKVFVKLYIVLQPSNRSLDMQQKC